MIVEVCYYDRFHIYLNHVAKNLGINVIELQHGLMGSKHLAYNFEPIETHLTGFPDNVLLFSQYWKDTTRLPLSEHNAIVVGFPMFDAMIRKNLREGKNCDKVNNILFISQWTVSSQMYDFAVKLSKNEKLNKYNIIYKLHPFEKKENFTNFPKIKIIGNEQSVYDLFPLARVQVGAYSTALYEGLCFGLPTFIISSLDEEENMKALHDEGFCDYVDSPEELVEKMENSAQSLPNDFWEKNAEKNMIDEIERLLWMQKE